MGPINLEDATANAVNLNLPDGNCSDLRVPAPYGRNIAPMSVYLRRGGLIGDGQKRVARAKPLTGDVGVSPTTKIPLLLARGCLTSPKGSDKRNSDLRIWSISSIMNR